MKYYKVTKIKANGSDVEYGRMCEEDMKLVVKGYRLFDKELGIYTKKGIKQFYIVVEA